MRVAVYIFIIVYMLKTVLSHTTLLNNLVGPMMGTAGVRVKGELYDVIVLITHWSSRQKF